MVKNFQAINFLYPMKSLYGKTCHLFKKYVNCESFQ